MSFVIQQSFSSFKSSNGTKKASFAVVKSKDGTIKSVKGESLDNKLKNFKVHEQVKELNNDHIVKNKVFKIKSSEISELLKFDDKPKLKPNTKSDKAKIKPKSKPITPKLKLKPKSDKSKIKSKLKPKQKSK
jgi:hypothetical protein